MATNTTPLGFRYPDGDEPPALDILLGNLAEDVDAYLGGLGWTAYTPTVTGVTIGNGSVAAYWTRLGKTILVRIEITLGSTSAVTGEVSFTLPVTAKYGRRTGTATGRITNAGNPYGLACWSSSSTTVQLIRYTGTNGLLTALSATAPGTWASTGWIEAELAYEPAA